MSYTDKDAEVRDKADWHDGKPTFDVVGVEADGANWNGIVEENALYILLNQVPPAGKSAKVRVWPGAGAATQEHDVTWPDGVRVPLLGGGRASVVVYSAPKGDPTPETVRVWWRNRTYKALAENTK